MNDKNCNMRLLPETMLAKCNSRINRPLIFLFLDFQTSKNLIPNGLAFTRI